MAAPLDEVLSLLLGLCSRRGGDLGSLGVPANLSDAAVSHDPALLSGEPFAPALSPGYCRSRVPGKRSVPGVRPHARISPDVESPPSRLPVPSRYPKGAVGPQAFCPTLASTHPCGCSSIAELVSGAHPSWGSTVSQLPSWCLPSTDRPPYKSPALVFPRRCCTRMTSSASHQSSSPPPSKPSPSSSWNLEQRSSCTIAYRH